MIEDRFSNRALFIPCYKIDVASHVEFVYNNSMHSAISFHRLKLFMFLIF